MAWPSWLRWGLALPLLTLNLYVLRQLLLPLAPFPGLFLTSALIAFLLDIPCRWLSRRGLPRWLAILLVTLVTVGALGLAGVTLVPRLIDQLAQLINALPSWLVQAEAWISGLQDWAASRGLPSEFGDLSSDLLTRVSRVASQFSQRLLGILGATLGTTINTVIVLVLAVFFLLGGDAITAGLARWLPEQWRALVISTITRTFRGYFGGQVLLALILSAGQILVFTLLSIPYGVLFAVLIGLTTLIPYASALTIVAVSALLAVQDPRTGLEILAAAIGVGQIVDQVIQPRLMGSIVGLQPAWLLIALPLGARAGDLLGLGELLGLLLAVPVASCFKTLVDAWVELRTSPESRPG
ncbi:MAG: AI-2E family transporter [Synechococcaceae bacterium WB9_4xC_028]|jgi:predicted PurR-regulated permease PerM|uniref:AI-2E family transporter n=1 Tax=Synechococcus sp. HK01-R TaxID=2751171 RepID=UPI001627915B|nr:AI-2E family transporter [Synechococcus sp. HK01-R]NDD45115.1 AI-2E family transporter [Synechococcaceae bacterium WB9_4xB_025]NDD69780.1 AI-2E family transporter [Synechococcaceae bacterium WB9_4xC_028]QNG27493.1 AI-2E family transporter [Synechococcus sp. HK01-R]